MNLTDSLRIRLLRAGGCAVLGMGFFTLATVLAAAQPASDHADASYASVSGPVEQQDLDSFLASEAAAEGGSSHAQPQVFFPDGDVGAAWPAPKKTAHTTPPTQEARPLHGLAPVARQALASQPASASA
ncbi:hypothetical protein, partial [Acetobacter peroxydans]